MQNFMQQPQQYGNYRPVFYKALPIANEAETLLLKTPNKVADWLPCFLVANNY